MRYAGAALPAADIQAAGRFCEDLFALEPYQDYGISISFSCGLSLQQEFRWLAGLARERVMKKSNNAELCFVEEDFDGFLDKLKSYPGAGYWGDVTGHSWGGGWSASTAWTAASSGRGSQ